MRKICVVQIFLEFGNGFCGGHADEIDLRRYAHGLLHADITAGGASFLFPAHIFKSRTGYLAGVHKLYIPDRNLGANDSGGNVKLSLVIRKCGYCSIDIHGCNMNGVTDADAFCGNRL